MNPTGMISTVELITPQIAQQLLDTMPKQRNIRPRRVELYSQERRAGRWMLTHQGLGLDVQGRLRDGQHRCAMVVATGLPTPFLVTRNIPEESFIHIDSNLPRSITDALHVAGHGDLTHRTVAVATGLPYPPIDHAFSRAQLSKDQVLWILEEDAEAINFVEEEASSRYLTKGVRILIARAFPYVDTHRLRQFCEVLRTGKVKHPDADDAALTYRENVLLSKAVHRDGHLVELEKYKKGQTSLETFFQKKPMSKVYGTDRNLYPWHLANSFQTTMDNGAKEE